jgi:hypothetical protein
MIYEQLRVAAGQSFYKQHKIEQMGKEIAAIRFCCKSNF